MTGILSALIGIIVGAVKEMIMFSLQTSRMNLEAWQAKSDSLHRDRKRAEKNASPEFQFARRLIVVTLMFILAAPVVAGFIWPDMTINVPIIKDTTGWNFLFWSKPSGEEVTYLQLTGFTYVMQIFDLIWLVLGFYMGSGGTRKMMK